MNEATSPLVGEVAQSAGEGYTHRSSQFANGLPGITQLTLQQRPADTNDYAPVFDVTNDVIKTIGVAQIAAN